jgi:diguanylate cyclase (GGDEF)-like protein/PAS domain S-box-containing protein
MGGEGDVSGVPAGAGRDPAVDSGAIELMLAGGASGRDAELLRAVFAQAGVGVGISDITGKILVVNAAFAGMFGYETEEFLKKFKVTDLTHPDDTAEVWDQYAALMRGDVEMVSLEKPHLHRDGHTIWNSVNVSLIRDKGGEPLYTLAVFGDVTERRQLEQQLRHQAQHDPLTGLPNRSQFFDRLDAAFEDPHTRVGICYVDLDGFKEVNDTLGHDIGDKLLVSVAERLALCLQRPQQIVARLGGDEFVFLLPQPDSTDEVTELADSVLRVLESPFDIDGNPIVVSASVGVMEQEVAIISEVDLMKGADVTLARAKQAGGNRWAIHDRHHENTPMHRALDRGEFRLVYQPIVRLADNCIIGAEALLRWVHPTLGTLLPDRFINLAERNGMIVPLTTFVVEQACRHVRCWREDQAADSQLFVSVNVAVRNICDPGFISVVKNALGNSGLPPHALQLELTENAVLGKDELSVRRLQQFSAMGVSIAIDDFGTGFSSLAYLRDLPIDVVKLAGEFIKNLGGNIHGRLADEQITRAMIDLAHTLGLTVTAEQVETASQAARLRALNCDSAQGWHFAKPMPPELFKR